MTVISNTQKPDGLVKNYEHPIRLQVFEGPLDLLLFLIQKEELDIYDIPVQTVTKQYLDVLHSMEKLNIEVAGEFFVMAATLMYIKSRMLLPKNEQVVQEGDEEEDFDPRWELVQQLIEYKKFKEAAAMLDDMAQHAQNLLPREYKATRQDMPERPLRPTDRIEVWNVFNQVLRRLAEKMIVGQIHDEIVTIADRMEFLLETLKTRQQFTFTSLFENESQYSIYNVIATFIAILELSRLKQLHVRQDAHFGEIHCRCFRPEDELPDLPAETFNEESAEPNSPTAGPTSHDDQDMGNAPPPPPQPTQTA